MRHAATRQRDIDTSAIDCREPFTIRFDYENKQLLADSRFFIVLRSGKGEVVFTTSDYDVITEAASNRKLGRFRSEVIVPGGLLKVGSYYGTIGADIKNERVIFAENDVLKFDVFETGDDTLAERHKRVGLVAPLLKWQISEPDAKPQS